MADFELVRVAVEDEGAFGVLKENGLPFCVTLERTFENNQIVIPPGLYKCRRTQFYGGNYVTFEVLVPGHSRVLFHIGNSELESRGCILLGRMYGPVSNTWGILESRLAFKDFMKRCEKRQEVSLEVREVL